MTQCRLEHVQLLSRIQELNGIVEKQISAISQLEKIVERTNEQWNHTLAKFSEVMEGQYLQLVQQAAGAVPGGHVPFRTHFITVLMAFGVGNISGGAELIKLMIGP